MDLDQSRNKRQLAEHTDTCLNRLSLLKPEGRQAVKSRIYLLAITTLCLMNLIDWPIALWVHEMRADPKDDPFLWAARLTDFGEFQYPAIAFLIFAIGCLFAGKKQLFWWAAGCIIAIGVAGALVHIPKSLFQRLRPEAFFRHDESGFFSLGLGRPHDSFPSGHSTVAGALFLCLWLKLKQWPKALIAWLLCALIAITRVLTNKHFVTDCIAGFIFGGVMAATLWHIIIRIGSIFGISPVPTADIEETDISDPKEAHP